MEIRKASKEDSNELLVLLKQIHAIHATNRPDVYKKGAFKYSIEDIHNLIDDDNKIIFVYVEDNHVLGYVIGIIKEIKNHQSMNDSKMFFIDDFCVDKNHKRKHIGTDLYQYVKNYCKENSFDRITLHVWSFNKEAISFYKSLGMEEMYYMMEDTIK